MIKFNDNNNLKAIDLPGYKSKFDEIYNGMLNKSLVGSDFLGWIDFIKDFDYSLIDNIKNDVKQLHTKAKTMVVVGIGGSYLGSLAIQKALFQQELSSEYKVLYIGNNMSSDYINEIYEYCKVNDFVLNVISKSGTTLEPALGARIFNELLIEKHGKENLKDYVIATTDAKRGALVNFAKANDLRSYVIQDDIGGRFSVFSAVGLLPLGFLNANLESLIGGASEAIKTYFVPDENNDAFKYALNRFTQYKNGKSVEALVAYEPRLTSLVEWYKQLFAESEGKDGKGLLPIGLINSTDLHSLGQFVQDGEKIMFETVVKVNNSHHTINVPFDEANLDDLNKLCKYTIHDINLKAIDGVINAHVIEGQVPNLLIEIDRVDEKNIGYLMAFMMVSCAYSAHLLGINPFNQPGVEVYKKEIFKLL